MNEIGYNLIIDKRVKRRIDILRLLLQSTQPITITHIAKKCSSSERTISAEIRIMNTILPQGIDIMTVENIGVSLVAKNILLLTNFINDQLDGNPLYKIIDSIFHGEESTLEDLSIQTFISESRLRVHLETLKKVLSDYSLSLKIRPYIDIVGSEVDIRFFFFQYFRHAHESVSVTPRKDQYEAIQAIYRELTKEFNVNLTTDYYRLSHWLLIFEQRISTRHFVEFNHMLIEKHSSTYIYQKIKEFFHIYFCNNKILNNIPEEEFLYFFIVRLDGIVYEVNDFFYAKEYELSLSPYKKIVLDFFCKNDFHPFYHSELKILLQYFLSNTQFLSDITPQFQKTNSAVIKYSELNHSKYMKDWYNLLTLNADKFPFDCIYMKDIAASLTFITRAYTELFVPIQKKVLFSLTGTPATLNYFKTKILNMLPKGVEPHFNFNKPLTNNLLDALDISTCIYNYQLYEPITYCRSIRMPNIPNDTDWVGLALILLFDTDNY